MLYVAEGKQPHLFLNLSCFKKTRDAEENLEGVCKAVTNRVEVDFATLEGFWKEVAQDEESETDFRSDHQDYDILLRVDSDDEEENPLDHPPTQKNDLDKPHVPIEATQKDVPQGDKESLDDQQKLRADFQRIDC